MAGLHSRWSVWAAVVAVCWPAAVASAQVPAFGPTQTAAQPVAAPWPARPPTRIYVMPFAIEPGLQEQLQQSQGGLVPSGPIRQALAGRPRVVDVVAGYDRNQPVGVTASRLLADELARAGLSVVAWNGPGFPPPDGWCIFGQVVSLDEGSAVARNVVGFGVGNKTIGIDVMVADPATAGGQPFFVLDSSDKGRKMPGTLAVGAIAGFNPYVVAGRAVASQSGISDVTQQQRLAKDIADSLITAFRQHFQAPAG
jgi:hypothetical protein